MVCNFVLASSALTRYFIYIYIYIYIYIPSLRHSLSAEDVTVTDMTRKESPISTCHQAADPSWEREMAQLPAVLVLPFKARFGSITTSGPLVALLPSKASPETRNYRTTAVKSFRKEPLWYHVTKATWRLSLSHQGRLLLTWFNFNPSMD